jgi:hypothetical protein
MEDTGIGAGPEFDVPDYQPMEDEVNFPLETGEGVGARSDARRSRSPSAQKRVSQSMNSIQDDILTSPQGRSEDQEGFGLNLVFPVLISIQMILPLLEQPLGPSSAQGRSLI